jgi:hypothetical protein
MEELARLFGVNAGIEDIVDVRVARMKMGGIVGAAIAGESPTELTVVLRDGRSLQARSRGPGPEEDAIEAFVRAASTAQAQLTLSAIAQGGRVPFGDAEVSFDGISYKGQLTPWESVGHWLVGQGYLFWKAVDGSEPKLWLGSTPFGDALVLVLANRIPDKDYRKIAATPEFQAAQAAKAKKTRVVVAVVVGVLLLGAGAIYGTDYFARKQRLAAAERLATDRIDALLAGFNANPGLPTCGYPSGGMPYSGAYLVAVDRSTVHEFDRPTNGWRESTMPRYLDGDAVLYAWGIVGSDVRILRWDVAKGAPLCASQAPLAGSTPLAIAKRLAVGDIPAPPPSASTSAAPPPPPPSASVAPAKTKKKKKGR